jgi:chromosome segregation ATPase
VEEITSADFVDSPAANQRGLFSKIDNQPVYKMTKAELIKKNEQLEAEIAELAECVEQFAQPSKLSDDDDKELGGHEDDKELEGHDDEEEEKEAAESLEEENEKLKSEIEELKAKLKEDEEKMAELQAELDVHKEEEMKKDEELAEAASQLSAKNDEVSEKETRIIELQAIVKGSEAVKFSKDDGDYSPSLSNRNQLIAQYAKDHKISEFSATLKLAKEKPEIFNI